MNQYMNDPYTKKALQNGNICSSYYKLKEIDKKFHLFKKNYFILDIGCYPGGWLVYSKDKVKEVVGVDIKNVKVSFPNISIFRGDMFDDKIISQVEDKLKEINPQCSKFNIIMSDAMVHTTGNKELDSFRSYEIVNKIIEILLPKFLKNNGKLIFKQFQGSEFEEILKKVKAKFRKVKCYKPNSSRNRSKEMFVICQSYIDNNKK